MGKAGGAKVKAESVATRRLRDLERQVEAMQAVLVQSAERPKALPGMLSKLTSVCCSKCRIAVEFWALDYKDAVILRRPIKDGRPEGVLQTLC